MSRSRTSSLPRSCFFLIFLRSTLSRVRAEGWLGGGVDWGGSGECTVTRTPSFAIVSG
ncbi:hypothetical protein PF005_g2917 [Phytophthora fragariae]|uniref:Secreted protein n=2 Tax=Phytophthora TaxID=4783 RepID=A0A6A3LJ55_9STRA|nr:hypothetical protein PF003_g13801 [Phytophthora fragariae]KAE9020783.1 hypothetical protein PR002_g12443 [Phytophthora rubi]KAE8947322.1 hypothetical protein PF009_g3074 [Phytophthora fragariae]KAE9016184.1 hypothetical protein PF011_g7279 [Phytophthora fragariae]KAE9040227.1 hypothetical protein PR001_g7175 [Phytophthora rubi]